MSQGGRGNSAGRRDLKFSGCRERTGLSVCLSACLRPLSHPTDTAGDLQESFTNLPGVSAPRRPLMKNTKGGGEALCVCVSPPLFLSAGGERIWGEEVVG